MRLLFAVNPTLEDVEIPLGEAAQAFWQQVADHEKFFSAGDHEPTMSVSEALYLPPLGCGLWMVE